MQNKPQSKSRLGQYASIKEYQSAQQPKRTLKNQTQKSNKKLKQTKSTIQSHSKGKNVSKTTKNNQNYNTVNIASNELTKPKNNHNEHETFKKQSRNQDRLKRISSEKLIKTKSLSKINIKTQRKNVSPSPLAPKQHHQKQEQKAKLSKNMTSRSQKQKKSTQKSKNQVHGLHKSSSKPTLLNKNEQSEQSNRNRVSIKTQISSKTHSVIKDEDKSKIPNKRKTKKIIPKQLKSERNKPYKIPKGNLNKIQSIIQRSILYSEVSFQQFNGQHPYESAFISNQKYYILPQPLPKSVKTQGCQIDRSNDMMNRSEIIKSVIKIQKVFRGYITRKYINEAKYIIGKVKIIQKWWRNILLINKYKLNKKIISNSNSLITIKDFNETYKNKQKIFSQIKQNIFSNNKINIKQFMKNIMQQNQYNSYSSIDKDQYSINLSKDKNISKDTYIQLKIQDQIQSQRKFNFNSPKNITSPNSIKTPTNCIFNIKQILGNTGSNQKQKIKQILSSPRINSPQKLKNTPQQINQSSSIKINKSINNQQIQTFQTNFTSIQEFCMLIVDYFRDIPSEMQSFMNRLQTFKYFRSNLILKTWNNHTLCTDQQYQQDDTLHADYQFLQPFQKPILFTNQTRNQIIKYPLIHIDLSGKRFNLQSQINAPIHRTFIQFIFDVLQQAFYQEHKSSIVIYRNPLTKYQHLNNQQLFQYYFSSALEELFKWGQVLCGLLVDIPPEQQYIKQERMRHFLKKIEPWDFGLSQAMAIKIQVSERIVIKLLQQFQMEILQFI